MNIMNAIAWLFPIIFMIHDFEEIVMINAWQEKNKQYIKNMKDKYIPFKFKGSTASISFGVAIEFVIISVLTIISYLLNSYVVWFGLFVAFVLHLLFHVLMCINFKKYVPGVVTSIIFFPLCCFMVYSTNISLHYNISTVLFSILIGTLIMMGIIYILHKSMKKFESWLGKYSTKFL